LSKVSIDTDNLLRQILSKVLLVDSALFLSDNNVLEEFYKKLLFNDTVTEISDSAA